MEYQSPRLKGASSPRDRDIQVLIAQHDRGFHRQLSRLQPAASHQKAL